MNKKSSRRSASWTASVAVAALALALAGCESAAGPSSEKSILSFSFASPAVAGVIDEAAGTVLATTISACDKTSMTPTISVSAGASVSPASGTAQDFTAPVVYTVTAEDGTAREYAVKVRTLAITTDPTSGLVIHVFVPSPTNVEATGGSRGAVVTWDPVSGASGYEVHYRAGGVPTIFSPQLPASAISGCRATATGLASGTCYYFIVVALKGGSESDASVFSGAYTDMEPPTNVKAMGGPSSVTLSWTPSTGATNGYYIHYREGDYALASDPLVVRALTGSSTVAVNGLKTGTQYGFVIVAQGDGSRYSDASAIAVARTDYAIGDRTPSGGWVFYDKGILKDGWRYMECAPSDQSGSIAWDTEDVLVVDTQTGIGEGSANTQTLVASYGPGDADGYPALICANLILGQFDDWFLPSKDELRQMYLNLSSAGKGNFASGRYWSSSLGYGYLVGKGFAVQDFSDGEQLISNPLSPSRVRAARRF